MKTKLGNRTEPTRRLNPNLPASIDTRLTPQPRVRTSCLCTAVLYFMLYNFFCEFTFLIHNNSKHQYSARSKYKKSKQQDRTRLLSFCSIIKCICSEKINSDTWSTKQSSSDAWIGPPSFKKIGRRMIPLIWAHVCQSEEGKRNGKASPLALILPAFHVVGHWAGTIFNNEDSANDKTCPISPSPLHFGPCQYRWMFELESPEKRIVFRWEDLALDTLTGEGRGSHFYPIGKLAVTLSKVKFKACFRPSITSSQTALLSSIRNSISFLIYIMYPLLSSYLWSRPASTSFSLITSVSPSTRWRATTVLYHFS